MIQSFADKYKKIIAYPLFVIFYLQTIILPLHAAIHANTAIYNTYGGGHYKTNGKHENAKRRSNNLAAHKLNVTSGSAGIFTANNLSNVLSPEKATIGGPSSPEATSFKAVGSDNLVNLFTGDFSYSVPLLDVGGYPVNLFYSGGITMEQEASWVGLGWNINPGTVSRNMRGVPDDFNGDDKLIQTQNVKPNRTWGGEVAVNGELVGIPKPKMNFSLGFSYNNYLGPELELGAGVSLNVPITKSIKFDKEASPNDTVQGLSANIGLNAKLNSRSGLTFSPSLNANLHLIDKHSDFGVGLSTSYNSRTGLKELNLSSQASTYRNLKKEDGKDYEKKYSFSGTGSSSISFARPTYIPTLRMPMQYSNYSGQFELGAGMWSIRGGGHAQGYYSESKVPEELRVVYKPLVGFIYSEKANGNKDAVMDFNRLNDAEVTPRTPVLSAPQYAYDIFSIQGEGTGGTIRAYRGDLGFMRDNETVSKNNNFSLGFDIAPGGHYGGNWNIMHSPTRVGGWEDANNTLRQTLAFKTKNTNGGGFENVYFRNPGEATVTNQQLIERIGGDNLVRFKLSGSNVNPRLESKLEQFSKNTLSSKDDLPIDNRDLLHRDKRTQVTTMLTAYEASQIGLEKNIRNYSGSFNADTTIAYTIIDRVGSFRKAHHISEIDVLEQSGMRYVYGLPVYSIKQKDFTFSAGNIGDPNTGIVKFEDDEPTIGSRHMGNKDKFDGYVMAQETPAYASSFLLTGLLSPDYVDVTGDGVTEDDLGSAVKFDYTNTGVHKWRTPRSNTEAKTAHFNDGLKSEKKDNKATISYGEREVWYLNAIESKSMVAIFKTGNRDDAKGVNGEFDGKANQSETANKRLDQIDLYTKAEIKARGIDNARPIKTVHFVYDYSLCNGTPDNFNGGGKLTLKSVYFSYNGQSRLNKDKYVFDYGKLITQKDNPSYANNASDKWGTYKNPSVNPSTLTNADYPYTVGDKAKDDEFAAVWSLKKILLPSGGQMEVQYEADDYAYVQNRRACDMFSVYGLGNSTNAAQDNSLYRNGLILPGVLNTDNFYVYIKLPKPLQNTDAAKQRQEIFDKYLEGINQLAFKLLINMPNGPEPLTVYANYNDYGLCSNSSDKDIIYVKLQPVDGNSPLVKSAIGFITENLPGQAFDGYEVDVDGVKAFLQMMGGMLSGIKNAFKNVDEQMRSATPPKARTIVLGKSFVRLDNPGKMKYGGGIRVKKVVVADNWQKMLTSDGGPAYGYTSTYGQEYDYTTTEKINGVETTISSGVASYEPGLGSEENPFREILSFSNKMPLASAQYGAIEMPMMEGLYPSPGVGYSKVTVRSIHRKGTHGDSAVRSAIGKQVTEFYTAKEFPVYAAYTPMASMDFHRNSFFNLLYKDITDRKVTSQGFLVETNDMHGKMKSQIAYSERDEKTPLSYSYHTYRNTGQNSLNDKVDFIYNDQGGAVAKGNMGIDMELMTDVREFRVQTSGFNGQIQTDFFTFVPFPFFIIPMLPLKTYTENKYRAVTCTKLINYHAIEDSVIVMDKGSVISTKTIGYDAETGEPIVTKTANEFNDPIYNTNYPAYWAYSGMSPAYKNINIIHTANFADGKISLSQADQNRIFESGDELYVTKQEDLAPASVIPKISGTASYSCSATNNGQGEVTLTFTFASSTPANLRFNVGWVYQNNQGYGGAGVTLPPYATSLDPGPYYIDIPAGVSSYTTPFPNLNSSGQFWACFDGLPNLSFLYKKAFILKVASPANYIADLVCPTPGLTFINDVSNVPPQQTQCITSSKNVTRLWAFDKNKNTTALTVPDKDLVFLDSAGNLFSKANVEFRIVRSGKRNLLGNSVASATTMVNPIATNVLTVTGTSNTVAASAMEFKEKWQTDNDVIKKYALVYPPPGPNLLTNADFSAGFAGYGTNYTYSSTSPSSAGKINVGTNPQAWNSIFANCGDHTSGSGNMLMADGSTVPGPVVSTVCGQTVTVSPNTDYTFSVWVKTLYAVSPASIAVKINNSALSTTLQADNTTCTWKKLTCTWNSGTSTTASIAVVDNNTVAQGNDFALDDLYFGLGETNICTPVEVVDCNGYLEKQINPYVKGLVGNYKGYRSMVYYGNREAIATSPNSTNIRKNGYLDNTFSMYWNFNGYSNLVPDVDNSKWVWNSQITKVNGKGQELETKDALYRYTAAQYGFYKNMPVTMTQNARYGESFAEGFEDNAYKERINRGAQYDCDNAKYINFNDFQHSNIVNTESLNFNAHTGKTVLKVNGTFVKQFNILKDSIDDYSLLLKSDTAKTNINMGANNTFTSVYPYNSYFAEGANWYTDGNGGMHLYVNPTTDTIIYRSNGWEREYFFGTLTTQFYNIPADGLYQISTSASVPFGSGSGGSMSTEANIGFTILTMNDDVVPTTYVNSDGGSYNYTCCLKKGIYKVNCNVYGQGYESCFPHDDQYCLAPVSIDLPEYNFQFSLGGFSGYKDLTSVNGCISTKPIAGNDSMLNPVFKLVPNKKMQFSAWVREDCGGVIPCPKLDYTQSDIQVWADGAAVANSTIKRTGVIIEGWQKIEGEFTIPINATSAELRFINTNTAPMYVDDIRIHPFNANMKSYAYDPRTLRLSAELDENNYASFYEYDEEGQLVRVKKETSQGIKTINETRASKQKVITEVVQ